MSNFEEKYKELNGILNSVLSGFLVSFKNEALKDYIYAIKTRVKSFDHLQEKIKRKQSASRQITPENLVNEITDLVGIRIIVLYPQYFKEIHKFIMDNISSGIWILKENPILFSWDDDTKNFFERELNFSNTEFRDSLYTSVHYVVRMNNTNNIPFCEIQVRTLLEEVFGEIDHEINYPQKTENSSMKTQLKVLAKMVAAASKLTESIYQAKND